MQKVSSAEVDHGSAPEGPSVAVPAYSSRVLKSSYRLDSVADHGPKSMDARFRFTPRMDTCPAVPLLPRYRAESRHAYGRTRHTRQTAAASSPGNNGSPSQFLAGRSRQSPAQDVPYQDQSGHTDRRDRATPT